MMPVWMMMMRGNISDDVPYSHLLIIYVEGVEAVGDPQQVLVR